MATQSNRTAAAKATTSQDRRTGESRATQVAGREEPGPVRGRDRRRPPVGVVLEVTDRVADLVEPFTDRTSAEKQLKAYRTRAPPDPEAHRASRHHRPPQGDHARRGRPATGSSARLASASARRRP